jgi:hypothetical protein
VADISTALFVLEKGASLRATGRQGVGRPAAQQTTVTWTTLAPGAPVLLFPTRIVGGGADVQAGRNYDVAPTGASSSTRNSTAPRCRSRC